MKIEVYKYDARAMGHKIKGGKDVESRYVIPPAPEQLKLYQEGYKNLDILGMRMEERLKAVEEVMASIPEEQQELMKKHGIKMMRKTRLEGGNGGNGGSTQRVVDEESLPSYLTRGWRVITALPSGNIVIEY